MARYGMVIDLRRCIGCNSCTVACKSENNIPTGVWRSWVKGIEKGEYPDPSMSFLPRLCNHCDHAPCVELCPVKASYKREDGLVLIDYDRCIGCGYCVVNCPYNSRFINPIRHTADKCTFCVQRLDAGYLPACVTTCIGRARTFGDLDDPKSEISQILSSVPTQSLRPELGTDPKVFYIMPDYEVMDRVDLFGDHNYREIEDYEKEIPSQPLPGEEGGES